MIIIYTINVIGEDPLPAASEALPRVGDLVRVDDSHVYIVRYVVHTPNAKTGDAIPPMVLCEPSASGEYAVHKWNIIDQKSSDQSD
ncbi:MAG: hypothetical protein MJA27_22885 [Pseudanabaenales cyanobacterium]|nr:hypothetical protein [Pseudanabaenales cyanobacterium]